MKRRTCGSSDLSQSCHWKRQSRVQQYRVHYGHSLQIITVVESVCTTDRVHTGEQTINIVRFTEFFSVRTAFSKPLS